MKKSRIISTLTILLCFLFCLSACGNDSETAAKSEQEPAAVQTADIQTGTDASEVSQGPDTAAENSSKSDIEIAREFIDKDVSELYEAIGEPIDSSYAESCLGDGEDGELIYDGFTVYTYREGDTEVVRTVL